ETPLAPAGSMSLRCDMKRIERSVAADQTPLAQACSMSVCCDIKRIDGSVAADQTLLAQASSMSVLCDIKRIDGSVAADQTPLATVSAMYVGRGMAKIERIGGSVDKTMETPLAPTCSMSVRCDMERTDKSVAADEIHKIPAGMYVLRDNGKIERI